MTLVRPLILATFVLASACATAIPELDPKSPVPEHLNPKQFQQHVLMFNTRGSMLDPLSGHTDPARVHSRTRYHRLIVGTDEYERYVQAIIAGIRERKRQDGHVNVLFFFHGGLNSRAAALGRAARDVAAIEVFNAGTTPGANNNKKIYPVFVNWETSAYGSYLDHLLWIKNGQDLGSKGPFLAPFQVANDLVRSAVDIPVAVTLEASDFWRSLTPHPHEKVVVAESCTTPLDLREGTSPELTRGSRIRRAVKELPTSLLTKWWAAGILSAAGSSAWSSMIYTSDRLFYGDFEMHHAHNDGYAYEHPSVDGAGGYARFLERLAESKVLDESDDVTLVAHSAGAIIANAVVGNFSDRLPIHTLVYMAPACTIDELMPGGRVATFLGNKTKPRSLYILALHEQAELNESGFLDITPRGSLLVWLDEFIQPKHSELRGVMMGRVRNLRTHAHLISCDLYDRIHITAYNDVPNADANGQPQRHGEFGDLQYWLGEDVWHPKYPGITSVEPTTVPRDVESATRQ